MMKTFARNGIAILIGLACLLAARPIFLVNFDPDVQKLLDMIYLDIRSEAGFKYVSYVNIALKYSFSYIAPFFIAGFLSAAIGKRQGGALLGFMPAFLYAFLFVYLPPFIHARGGVSSSAYNWWVWAVLHPMLFMLSGVLGGVIAWTIRDRVHNMRKQLRTTL